LKIASTDMMRFVTTQDIDVQIAPRFVGKALQKFFHQTDTKLFFPTKRDISNAVPVLRLEPRNGRLLKSKAMRA